MRVVFNDKLEKGTFRIRCTYCGYLYYGPAEGDRTTAARKAAELFVDSSICPQCGGEVVIEINPTEEDNKYNASHPYPDFILP